MVLLAPYACFLKFFFLFFFLFFLLGKKMSLSLPVQAHKGTAKVPFHTFQPVSTGGHISADQNKLWKLVFGIPTYPDQPVIPSHPS